MTTQPTPTIPGAGLSYADLTATSRSSEERAVWSALTSLADAVGVESMKSTGYSPRTKTIDELVADLTEALPERIDLLAASRATSALFPEFPQRTTTFEVRILGTLNGETAWNLVERFSTQDAADAFKADQQALYPAGVYLAVSVETTTTHTIR